jgi:hypothetical protein
VVTEVQFRPSWTNAFSTACNGIAGDIDDKQRDMALENEDEFDRRTRTQRIDCATAPAKTKQYRSDQCVTQFPTANRSFRWTSTDPTWPYPFRLDEPNGLPAAHAHAQTAPVELEHLTPGLFQRESFYTTYMLCAVASFGCILVLRHCRVHEGRWVTETLPQLQFALEFFD